MILISQNILTTTRQHHGINVIHGLSFNLINEKEINFVLIGTFLFDNLIHLLE